IRRPTRPEPEAGKKRWRFLVPLPLLAGVGVVLWWRGPDWGAVGAAFGGVRWAWVVVAIALNLASVVARAGCWQTVIKQAMPPPRPGLVLVFSAFCVGLLANVV